MKISTEELKKVIVNKLNRIYDLDDSESIAEVIMCAELSGKVSHGIVRLTSKWANKLDADRTGKPKIIKISQNVSLVDGCNNAGMLVLSVATDEAIKLAGQNSLVLVGTKNGTLTSGYISYYLRKLADNGLIGMIMARSGSAVRGFGSTKPLFGTNPIGYGFPQKDNHFIFDMSTAIISYGGLMNYMAQGKPLPEGLAFDPDGKPTTDAAAAMKGSVVTFDKSYKSAGLALMVEVLAGIFTGADFSSLNENNWGNLILGIKSDLFLEAGQFESKLQIYLDGIRKDIPDHRLPGDIAEATYKNNVNSGFVDVDDKTFDIIQK